MMIWCFSYDEVKKTIVSVDLNTAISNMVEHMEEILLNLGLRELVSLFEKENISPDIVKHLSLYEMKCLGLTDMAVIMKLRKKCMQCGYSKPGTLNVAGRPPTFLIPKENSIANLPKFELIQAFMQE